jgi:OsmC-like protein
MLEYDVVAKRIDAHGSSARCKDTEIVLDTDVNGRTDAFNPAELLLAAIAACMIKGMERIAPMNHFKYRGVEVRLYACCRHRGMSAFDPNRLLGFYEICRLAKYWVDHPPHGITLFRELIAVAVAQIDRDPVVRDRLV